MRAGKSLRGRTEDNEPNPIDIHVGKRIRLRRTILHITQQQLAEMLGLTFQQVQKYEKGLNRVGASRLWDISRVLDVPMGFFFEDVDESSMRRSPMMLNKDITEMSFHDVQPVVDDDPMKRAETLELVRAYYKITNRALAKNIFNILVTLSHSSYNEPDFDEQDDDE